MRIISSARDHDIGDEDMLHAVDRPDVLDPAGPARDAVELRAIHDIAESIAAAEQRLRDAVVTARAAGYSWGKIGASLGVTAQAAHKRYAGIT